MYLMNITSRPNMGPCLHPRILGGGSYDIRKEYGIPLYSERWSHWILDTPCKLLGSQIRFASNIDKSAELG